MKKTLVWIAFLGLQFVSSAQPIKIKKILDDKVSYEVTFTQITIAEATRDRIDNNDCRQVWGDAKLVFFELDANGQMDITKPLQTDMDQKQLFQHGIMGRSYTAKSHFQDRRGVNEGEFIKRISVRVSESMVRNRRIVALVSYQMYTAHKDNDLATYDRLRMVSRLSTSFYLEDIASKEETVSMLTNSDYTIRNGSIINGPNPSEDAHRIWLHFVVKKKP
jgi:hypothetical protein